MLDRYQSHVMPFAAIGLSLALAVWWFAGASGDDLPLRLPNQDGVPDRTAMAEQTAVTAGAPIAGEGEPAKLEGTWSAFRGDQRDGIVASQTPLARSWPSEGPPVLWTLTLGEGYAGAAIQGGCAYILDYDEDAEADTLRCLSLDDGREVWRNSYPIQLTRNHGLSRTTPAIANGKVVTMGPRCHVVCWDAATGEALWLIDLVREHQAIVPRWYNGQCPLIDDGRVILAPCGDALLVAVDLETGEVVWKSPNPRKWEMTHASIMPMNFAGQESYLYCGSEGLVAVAAEDGRILWDTTNWPTVFATCPSPLVLPDGKVLLSSGYGRTIGSLLLEARNENGDWSARTLLELAPKQFNSEHHTPIFYQGHIYGVRKRGGQLVCLDPQGGESWNSGRQRFGHGPYLIADGLIFVMDDRGQLTMAEASPEGYKQLGQCQVFADGHDAWGPMAMADGRLILREMTRMACLDLGKR